MALFRKLVITAVTAATMIVATAPADAQRWGRGYGWGGPRWGHGGWGYRGYRGGDVGGALVGGLIIGGIVGAIAASERDRDRDRDSRPLPPSAEDRAADACASAVERERQADVRSVTRVDWLDEAWIVEGVVDGAAAGPDSRPDSFSCSYRFGQVDSIRYGSDYRPRG